MNLISKIIIVFCLVFCSNMLTAEIFAQGKQAVVLMRTNLSNTDSCDGTTDLNYQLVYDLRFNNKDEIRLLNSAGNGSPDGFYVSRKTYEDAGKNKIVNMYQIRWQNDFLVAQSSNGQTPLLLLPEDMKPQKNTDMPMNSFYSVMLSGEAREGKQKRKISVALRDVWKIYFIPEGGNVNDTLFAHANEEKSVVIWDAFLKKTSNYRAAEANALMRDVLIGCVQVSLDQFKNGNYKALEIAQQRTERAQSVRSDETTTRLMNEINQHRKRINEAREQFYQLVTASRWDEAIAAAEPIKIYLSTWEDLNSLYQKALEESHKLHLAKGKQALDTNQLDVAKNECTIAWQRLPNSGEARGCVCQSRNRIALRDSNSFRQRKQPKQAKELLENQIADADCTPDETVLSELKLAKCEYSQQLFDEAKRLTTGTGAVRSTKTSTAPVGALKPITAQNKKDFRDARDKLVAASEMCPLANATDLLGKINNSLSTFLIAEAKKATARGDFGTAYVYLVNAQGYTPGSESLAMQLNQTRAQFEEKTRVHIGVVFYDKSRGNIADMVINAVTSEIESNATRVGLSQPVILERSQSVNALRMIQNGANSASPIAIFTGDLISANVNVSAADRSVRSYYQLENPEWKRRDYEHDAAVDQHKACKKQYGEANCGSTEARMKDLKRWRDSVNKYNRYEYYYNERLFQVVGNASLTFRYADNITRATQSAETLTASVTDQCVERSGVDSRDNTAQNTSCSRIQDGGGYAERITRQLQSDAGNRAYSLLRDLPMNFYRRAKSATNRQQSVEDYIRFLFLSNDKNSTEAGEAKRFLIGYDTELETDGVMR